MTKVPNCLENIAEYFNQLSRAHEGCRQTTDGRGTAYSVREREFTFAKTMNLSVEHRTLVKNFYFSKTYGAVTLINEVPAKEWKKSTLNNFVKRLKQ